GGLELAGITISAGVQRGIGIAILVATLGVLAMLRGPAREVKLWRWRLRCPSLPQALGMIATSAIDLALASAALLILVPGAGLHAFPTFF
ncbi:hypothetical protein, partial [Acinetobacter pittii]